MTDDDVTLPEPDFHAFNGPRYYTAATVRRLIAEAVERERSFWTERVEDAFREGYGSRDTYNDTEVSDIDEKWNEAKPGLLKRKEQR